jgi:hypothetical protein
MTNIGPFGMVILDLALQGHGSHEVLELTYRSLANALCHPVAEKY